MAIQKRQFNLLIIAFLFCISSATAQNLTAEQIIKKADDMLLHKSSESIIRMTIHLPRGVVRSKEMQAWSVGNDTSFVEFTSPARDKGSRYLKLGKSMWVYFPRAAKTILIKGHMLRQSMMGSDFSYEDALESSSLLQDYNITLLGSEKYDGYNCYKLELTAKKSGLTYYRRVTLIDKKTFIPVHSLLYAKSGKLMKTFDMSNISKIGNRYFPTKWTMKDELRQDTMTVMELINIKFDVPISAHIFSKRNLEKR